MSIETNNDGLMGAPFSNIRDGQRWGRANKDMPFARGYREQIIKTADGTKTIKHRQ